MGKKYLLRINVSLLLLIIISLFCSCTGEMNILEEYNNEQINFSVSVPEWKNIDSLSSLKTSRATPITDASLNTSNTFNLIADQNDGAGNYSTLINSQAVTCTNNLWKTSNDYYWSGTANKTINFYAYYPNSISNIAHTAGSAPTLSYTIPDNVTNQIDIITATSTNISGNTVTPTSLAFKHIFAAIQFLVGSNGIGSGSISSISIGNVANSGTYTFGSGWSNVTGSKTFTISQLKTITGTSGEDIYSGTYTLMMIPQAINNVTITITYSNGGTLTKTISGTWEAENIYNYKLAFIREYNYTGAVQSFSAPISGTYKLEVYGAQSGGWGAHINAPGGYACGYKKLSKGDLIYIVVGGKGYDTNHYADGTSYNGGGTGAFAQGGTYGGGGATHMATHYGLLKDLSEYKSTVLIVGGGAGSNGGWAVEDISRFECGGGEVGLGSNTTYYLDANTTRTTIGNTGGTQSGVGPDGIKGGFGYGGSSNGYTGVGGGGWYGGNASGDGGVASQTNGGGGSGYIGGVDNGSFQTGVRYGNGYARITFVSAN